MRRGVTLIEILLAFGLLVSALFAVLSLLPVAMREGASADLNNRALFAAQQRMDEILASGIFVSQTPQSQTIPGGTELTVVFWGEPASPPHADLQLVTVEVGWLEQELARNVRLKCLMAR